MPATKGNAAYRVSAERKKQATQSTHSAHLMRTLPPKKPAKHKARRTLLEQLAGGLIGKGILLAIVALYSVYSDMQLTLLIDQKAAQEERLDEVKAQSVSLAAKQAHSLDWTEVEMYASSMLGMVKMENSQIEYIELKNPDMITVAGKSSDTPTFFSSLGAMVRGLFGIEERREEGQPRDWWTSVLRLLTGRDTQSEQALPQQTSAPNAAPAELPAQTDAPQTSADTQVPSAEGETRQSRQTNDRAQAAPQPSRPGGQSTSSSNDSAQGKLPWQQ